MNRTISFLIVLVLLARGGIYIYEKNKEKIDNLVSKPETTVNRDSAITEMTVPVTDTQDEHMSPFTMTFLVTGDDEVYYYTGEFNGSLSSIGYGSLGIFIKTYKNAVKPDDLMFIIKADKTASTRNITDVLDEMEKNEVPTDHYAERKISKEEVDKIKILKGN